MSGKRNCPTTSSSEADKNNSLNNSAAALNALMAAYAMAQGSGAYAHPTFSFANGMTPFGATAGPSALGATPSAPTGFGFWPSLTNEYLLSMIAAANLHNLHSPTALASPSPSSSFSPANKNAMTSSILNGSAEENGGGHVTESFEELLQKMARPTTVANSPAGGSCKQRREGRTTPQRISPASSSAPKTSGLATLAQVASCIKAAANSQTSDVTNLHSAEHAQPRPQDDSSAPDVRKCQKDGSVGDTSATISKWANGKSKGASSNSTDVTKVSSSKRADDVVKASSTLSSGQAAPEDPTPYTMDPDLLNASAMAWAALSNRLLLAASLQQQQHQQLIHNQQNQRNKKNEENWHVTNSRNSRINRNGPSSASFPKSDHAHGSRDVVLDCSPGNSAGNMMTNASNMPRIMQSTTRRGRPPGSFKRINPPPSRETLNSVAVTAGANRSLNGAKINEKDDAVLPETCKSKKSPPSSSDYSPVLDLSVRSSTNAPSIDRVALDLARKRDDHSLSATTAPLHDADDAAPSSARKRNVRSAFATSAPSLEKIVHNHSSKRHCSRSSDDDVDRYESTTAAPSVEHGHFNTSHTAGNRPSSATSAPSYDDNADDAPPLTATAVNRRAVPEIEALRVPLGAGWRRQTCVRCVSASGVRGDVVYYAPCGKRLGSYAEVTRYLVKNRVKNLGRDNFSFSCKALVGNFLHVKSENGRNSIVPMSEKDVRIIVGKLQEHQGIRPPANSVPPDAIPTAQDKPAKLTFQFHETNPATTPKKRGRPSAGGVPVYPVRSQNENPTLSSCQENSPEGSDSKEKRSRGRPSKYSTASSELIAKDESQKDTISANKKQDYQIGRHVTMLAWEREKARQHAVLQHTLEIARQKEERKRLYAEKFIREQEKLAARNAYLLRMKFLRQPVEDLELQDSKKLVDLKKIENLHMDAGAFSDLLMVVEFVNNFGEVLKISSRDIPQLHELHAGLLNEKKSVRKLLRLTKVVLTLVLEYPGLTGPSAKTFLGPSYKDFTLDYCNLGEFMRMFLVSRGSEGVQLASMLENNCFEALSPAKKTAILAFMCNELLYCRNVVREIENNIDFLNKLRGDKWLLDGRQKHLKSMVANRKGVKDSGDESDQEKKLDPLAESMEEDETLEKLRLKVMAESEPGSTEEAKILEEDSIKYEQKASEIQQNIRAIGRKIRQLPLGQDRYHRIFWTLPSSSNGLLVETIESSCRHPKFCVPPEFHQLSLDRAIRVEVSQCLNNVVSSTCELLDQSASRPDTSIDQSDGVASDEHCEAYCRKICAAYCRKSDLHDDLNSGWFIVDDLTKVEDFERTLNNRGVREKQLLRTLSQKVDEEGKKEWFADTIGLISDKLTPIPEIPTNFFINMAKFRRIYTKLRDLEEKVFHYNVSVKSWKPPDYANLDAEENDSSCSDFESNSDSSDSKSDQDLEKSSKISKSSSGENFGCLKLPQNTNALISLIRQRMLNLHVSIDKRYFDSAFNESYDEPTLCKNGDLSENSVETSTANNFDESQDAESTQNVDSRDRLAPEKRWRLAIHSARSPAQLSMCLDLLDGQVLWEKSAARAMCQICRRGDDDSQLLLCDGCDMGYHTYCFKPKLDSIPDGDWYCPECVSKATRRPCCLLCCRQTSRPMVSCQECQHNFHCDCVVVRMPGNRGSSNFGKVPEADAKDWTCDGCLSSNAKNLREAKNPGRKVKSTRQQNLESDRICRTVEKVVKNRSGDDEKILKSSDLGSNGDKVTPRGTKRRPSRDLASNGTFGSKPASPLKFAELCGIILAELDAHKDSWPFKSPVDLVSFPLYKEIIEKPMDLCLIRQNLNSNTYRNSDVFLNDVTLMFDNCKTFNEDDSPVGKAGHNLRRFLKKRWKELKEATCVQKYAN